MEQLPKFKPKGNLQLLEEPLTASFCSSQCPGDLILKTCDLARTMRDADVYVRWRKQRQYAGGADDTQMRRTFADRLRKISHSTGLQP